MRARHAIATELEKKQEGMKYCLALSHSSTEIIVGARSGEMTAFCLVKHLPQEVV